MKKFVVVIAAATLALAGCGSSNDSASSTSTTETTAAISTTIAPTTTAPVAGAYYLYATSAKTQGASTTITGTTATFADGKWTDSQKSVATVLANTQPVVVLTSASETKTIQASELPAYLPTDAFGKLYRIDGDVSAPNGLTEIYNFSADL